MAINIDYSKLDPETSRAFKQLVLQLNKLDSSDVGLPNVTNNQQAKPGELNSVNAYASSVNAYAYSLATNVNTYATQINAYASYRKIAVLRDEKTQNTAGGTATSGAWQTRDINRVVYCTIEGLHLDDVTSTFTLPVGYYYIEATAPSTYTVLHQGALYNVNSASNIVVGSSESSNTDHQSTRTIIRGHFSVTSTSNNKNAFKLVQRVNTTRATYGWGEAANLGTEVYTEIFIEKLDSEYLYKDTTYGGAITEAGGYRTHTFTTSGIFYFYPSTLYNVEYLVVAGGAGGGSGNGNIGGGGGGGGGIMYSNNYALAKGTHYILVGNGGASGSGVTSGGEGGNSAIDNLVVATGGGSGASYNGVDSSQSGGVGGSGGGSAWKGSGGAKDAAMTKSNNGGNSTSSANYGGGGGGGGDAAGANGTTAAGGNGGNGTAYTISGASVSYGAGGGGGFRGATPGTGGTGGGGNGGTDGNNGANATGYGCGGGAGSGTGTTGGTGSAGIVIIKFAI